MTKLLNKVPGLQENLGSRMNGVSQQQVGTGCSLSSPEYPSSGRRTEIRFREDPIGLKVGIPDPDRGCFHWRGGVPSPFFRYAQV